MAPDRSYRRRVRTVLLAGTICAGLGAAAAHAQLGSLLNSANSSKSAPVSKDEPVTFQADQVEYDRDGALVTWSGHVEAWQGDRVVRADKVTFDRNTDVLAASGHVVLVDPDGQVLFSDYAELTQGMKNGILTDMRAQLAENGKLAANGARRTDAQINELSRVIYSTCNVCAQHPDQTPLWDIRARSALQDIPNKRIEYQDAVIDFKGVPVAYFPYFTQPDPSQKRASGFLVPSIGQATHLGTFFAAPYYLVLDDQSDATLTPLIGTDAGPQLGVQYRRLFNDGKLTIDSSIAYDQKDLQGHFFGNGNFVYDDTYRYGFSINRGSSVNYLRDFRIGGLPSVLASAAYVEGFGEGAYTRLDAHAYQSLTTSVLTANIPYAVPRYTYNFVGQPDALGGRTSVDVGAFNVIRDKGTTTQRASLSANWERPINGALGDLYKLVLHLDSAAYNATALNEEPNFFSRTSSGNVAQAQTTAAWEFRWPFVRYYGSGGSQLIEPIAQLVAAPNGSSYQRTRIPNEDSFDIDFTDANLFSLNRYPGLDRLEGGLRANVALHATWTFEGGSTLDGLVGQGYRVKKDKLFPVGSGLEDTVSDVVSHLSFAPNKYFDITSRQRFNHKTLNLSFADALASGGPDYLRVNAGYIYSKYDLFNYYSSPTTSNVLPKSPRNEISLGASTGYGNYKVNGFVRRDLALGKMVGVGANGSYEDECFIFNVNYFRRYVSVNNDNGATTILFTVTLKTVGQFGFHAS